MQRYKMEQITPLKRLQNIIERAVSEGFEVDINDTIRQNAIEAEEFILAENYTDPADADYVAPATAYHCDARGEHLYWHDDFGYHFEIDGDLKDSHKDIEGYPPVLAVVLDSKARIVAITEE